MAKEKVSDIYKTSTLEDFVSVLFQQFAEGRKPYEEVWRDCWWNYIGQYNPDKKLQTTEGQYGRSRIFVRLTQQKVRAAQAKIMESLGFEIPFKMIPLNDNPVTEYQLETIANAQKDIIRNQFKDINLRDLFDTQVLEMCIYGTAILKGPVISKHTVEGIVENTRNVLGMRIPMWKIPFKGYSRWRRVYEEAYRKEVYAVSIWDFYTDNNADDAESSIGNMEKHEYTPYEFQNKYLNNNEYDQENVIKAFNMACVPQEVQDLEIKRGEKYMGEQTPKDTQVTVIEYWGQAPYNLLKPYLKNEEGEDVNYKDTDIVECAVTLAAINTSSNTLANPLILKASINQSGKRIYKVCPFVKIPGSPYGIGVAESIKDSQKIINSLSRLLIDNKVLSGNGMFAIQKDQLDTRATKDGLKVYPGKVFFVKGDVNQAIRPLIFPDITGGIELALDRFERWADEESGIPKYSQGEASSSFLNKTASGMSMIINQSNIFLKTTLRNIDEFWIKPLAKDFNALNEIDGSYPNEINYPLDVVALGVDSLMAKEVKFESAMKLFQVAKETDLMPYINKTNALRMVADLLDVKGLVVSEVEAEQVSQNLQMQAALSSQANLSANIGSDLLNALTEEERAQLLSKMGIQSAEAAEDKLLIKKAKNLELDTQAKIMVNDRKELGKAQGKAADEILGSMIEAQENKVNKMRADNGDTLLER